ncbi:alpha/beta fold hydrolase [soil metagenome]
MVMTNEFLQRPGCKIAYELRGAGEPVLFIQGVGVHGDGWLPQVEALSARFQCLTFDNRGMGASTPLTVPLTMDSMTEDALTLMDAAGWQSAHVVGHSMGSLLAMKLAIDAPQRVRSLALLCAFPNGRDATALSARMLWLGMRSRIGTRRMRRNAFLEIIMAPAGLAGADRDALAAKFAPLFGHDLADQPPIVMKQLSCMRGYNALPRLGELGGIRTLAVSAAHDPIAPPRHGRAIADAIPGARYVEFADASHGLPISHSAQINELLTNHFQT